MLDELVQRFGEGAVVRVAPYVSDSGETLRWIVEIDGKDVSDVDARERRHPDDPDTVVMFLVHGDEEVEVGRWSTKEHRYGPAAFLRTLGDLRRRQAPL